MTASAKTMGLLEKQQVFMRLLPQLIHKAHSLGYEVTLGDGYRDPRVFGKMGTMRGYGRASSAHKQRLAIDLNLFRSGQWLQSTEDHLPLGKYWESLGGVWGGESDPVHFEAPKAWTGRRT